MKQLGVERVAAGGVGNKCLMLLEVTQRPRVPSSDDTHARAQGRATSYVQDRGVSRWDSLAPFAVLQAHGGVTSKLASIVRDGALAHYRYAVGAPLNADFERGLATLTRFNARDAARVGAPALDAHDVLPFANLCGLFALAPGEDVPRYVHIVRQVAATTAPSFD